VRLRPPVPGAGHAAEYSAGAGQGNSRGRVAARPHWLRVVKFHYVAEVRLGPERIFDGAHKPGAHPPKSGRDVQRSLQGRA
jgi:hypothetical protein